MTISIGGLTAGLQTLRESQLLLCSVFVLKGLIFLFDPSLLFINVLHCTRMLFFLIVMCILIYLYLVYIYTPRHNPTVKRFSELPKENDIKNSIIILYSALYIVRLQYFYIYFLLFMDFKHVVIDCFLLNMYYFIHLGKVCTFRYSYI